jgi:hypothetical protein
MIILTVVNVSPKICQGAVCPLVAHQQDLEHTFGHSTAGNIAHKRVSQSPEKEILYPT